MSKTDGNGAGDGQVQASAEPQNVAAKATSSADSPKIDGSQPGAARKKQPRRKRARNASFLLGELRHNPEEIRNLFRNGTYPYKTRIRRLTYERHKEELQVELLKVQNWVKLTGQRIVVLFEGRDAAGKGGTIKRFMEHLNPRAARKGGRARKADRSVESGSVVFSALHPVHLPTRGEILFSRPLLVQSRRRRAGHGFLQLARNTSSSCASAPEFERMLASIPASGCSSTTFRSPRTEQQPALRSHAWKIPLKQWKTEPGGQSLGGSSGVQYTRSQGGHVLLHRHRFDAPWTIIKSDDKKRARLNCMQHFLAKLDYPDKDEHVVHGPDPLIVGTPSQVIEKDAHLWG